MKNRSSILSKVIIIVLLAGNIIWGFQYFNLKKEVEVSLHNQVLNDKVLAFTNLFIDKVLTSNTEVDFDTRLKLENSIRELENKNILTQWQKFTASKTEADAQIEVKNLLQMLVNNIHA